MVRRETKATYMPTMPAKVPKRGFSTALADGMLARKNVVRGCTWRKLDRKKLHAADMHVDMRGSFEAAMAGQSALKAPPTT